MFTPKGYSWRVSKEKLQEMITEKKIYFGPTGENAPRIKRFLVDVKDGVVSTTLWTRNECGDNQEAKREIKALFSDEKIRLIPQNPNV